MSRWLRIVGYAATRALARLRRRLSVAFLTVFVMTIALLLVGLAHLVERNLETLSKNWGSGVQMIVYLDVGISDKHAQTIRDALESLPAVEEATYVSPEEAFGSLRRSLGDDDELVDGIEASFVPASLEVKLARGIRELARAQPVIDRLEATPGVEEVSFLGNWVDDMTLLIRKVERAGFWLMAIATLVGIFTIIAAMRLSADSRRNEERVLYLMGAPATMRSGPNLIEGTVLGFCAALCAVVALHVIFSAGAPALSSALQGSVGSLKFEFLRGRDLVQLVFLGTSLGLIGGLVTNYVQRKHG